ncbi:hypothetical protein [Leptospira sp. id769339]|uniref:hypothetical protein n=1 Tax=Leptospira sp. id769339 TaxID=2864221 RepID=UPI00214BEC83|nr:hypothetical protein [Leptospira sp. id769339]MCR1795367.1 hypothetical protein [Leptospira sp. id769339]
MDFGYSETQKKIISHIHSGTLYSFVKTIKASREEPLNIAIIFRDLKTKVRALDITYDEKSDSYNLKIGKEINKGFIRFSKLENIYFDQFDDLLDLWTGHQIIRA